MVALFCRKGFLMRVPCLLVLILLLVLVTHCHISTASLPTQPTHSTALAAEVDHEHDRLTSIGEECFHEKNIQCAYNHYWEAVRVKPASGRAQAGLGLALHKAGGAHLPQAGHHLTQALMWLLAPLPPTVAATPPLPSVSQKRGQEGHWLRMQGLVALAELKLHPMERLTLTATNDCNNDSNSDAMALAKKVDASDRTYEGSLRLFDLALSWAEVEEEEAGRRCGNGHSCDMEGGGTRVDILMRKAWFCKERHQLEDSLAALHAVLVLYPSHMLAHLHIGNIYFGARQYTEAMKWHTLAYDVATNKKDKLLALNNLGSVFRIAGEIRLALLHYWLAFEVIEQAERDSTGVQQGDGTRTGKDLGGMKSSSYMDLYTIGNLLTMMGLCISWEHYEVLEHLKWQRVQQVALTRLLLEDEHGRGGQSRTVYSQGDDKIDLYSLTLGRYNTLEVERLLAQETCGDPEHATTAPSPPTIVTVTDRTRFPKNNRKMPVLKVGYVSYDWRDHPMGRLTSYFVTHHNPLAVASHAFSYGPDDGSFARKRVENGPLIFEDIQSIPVDDVAADVMLQYELDIVIDLTLWTENGRVSLLSRRRVAPVTINYLGFPGTSGCTGFDFALVDRMCAPSEISPSFSEKLLYVPAGFSYQANDMPFDVAPCPYLLHHPAITTSASDGSNISSSYRGGLRSDVEAVVVTSTAASQGRQSLRRQCQARVRGVHTTGTKSTNNILLCSFNAEKKFEPIVLTAWMNILRRVSSALLLLLVPSDFARRNILAQVAAHGISEKRIMFLSKLPWKKHLHRVSACDLLLDTLVYGAHTTASDLLWQWVPVVSLSAWGSGRMPSRVAASILHSLSSPHSSSSPSSSPLLPQPHHTVAYSVAEYEDIVVRLARSETLLFSLKHRVAVNSLRSVSFDKVTRQRVLELTYQLAWEIRGLIEPHKALYHILAGEMGSSSLGDSHSAGAGVVSQLGPNAVRYLLALDCRLQRGRQKDGGRKGDSETCEVTHNEDIFDDTNPTAGKSDGGNGSEDVVMALLAAREAVLLRLAASTPHLLSFYYPNKHSDKKIKR